MKKAKMKPVARGAEILKEHFSENTGRHRRNLVAVSTLSIIITMTGWFPTEISSLGLNIDLSDKQIIIWGLIISILIF
jgi:hypothetical protein